MTKGYEALHSGAARIDMAGRGLIEARGRDRVRLLHNLTSNEVKKMTPGQGCYAFLLSPQGRIQADVHLFCLEDRFLIDTEPELAAKVLAHIRRYIIADQVELEDVSDRLAAVGIEGPGAAAVLASMGASLPGEPFAHVPWKEAVVAAATATGQPGFRVYLPAAAPFDVPGAVSAATDDVRTVRIENGKPRFGEDIGEMSLVQETGQMEAVSFTKGCYLGQEIVERVRARGHVNRRLVRLEIDAATPPAAGTKVMAGGAEAGEVTSAAWSPRAGKAVALAYVRVPSDAPGTALEVGGSAARVGAVV